MVDASNGVGTISRQDDRGYITVALENGVTTHGIPWRSSGLTVATIEQLFEIQGDIALPLRGQLAAFDGGDPQTYSALIRDLEKCQEFAAVHRICACHEQRGLPLDFFLLTRDSKALRRLERPREARTATRRALAVATKPVERAIANTIQAAALCDENILKAARATADEALAENMNSHHALRAKGRILVKLSRLQEADETFARAELLDPNSGDREAVGAYSEHARSLVAGGKSSEVEEVCAHVERTWRADRAKRALAIIRKELERFRTRTGRPDEREDSTSG